MITISMHGELEDIIRENLYLINRDMTRDTELIEINETELRVSKHPVIIQGKEAILLEFYLTEKTPYILLEDKAPDHNRPLVSGLIFNHKIIVWTSKYASKIRFGGVSKYLI